MKKPDALRLLTVLVAAATLAMLLAVAAEIERSARTQWQARGGEEAARLSQVLMTWLEFRRESLLPLAALYAGSEAVDAAEFDEAVAQVLDTDDEFRDWPFAYAELGQDGDVEIVRYSGHAPELLESLQRGVLADVAANAFSRNRSASSRPFRGAGGRWITVIARPVHGARVRGLVFTAVDLTTLVDNLRTLHVPPGMRLALAVEDDEGDLTWVGDPHPDAAGGVAIALREYRAGSHWLLDWRIDPGYAGGPALDAASTLRWLALTAVAAVAAAVWLLIGSAARARAGARSLADALARLRERESQLRRLIDQMPGAVYRCRNDADWTVDYISPAIEEFSGWPASDFIGNKVRTLESAIHPDDRAAVRDGVDAAVSAGRPYELEYRILRSDGSVAWVIERGQALDEDGAPGRLEGIIIDVTERRSAEDAVRALNATLEQRVAMRTAELADANARLQDSIAHLRNAQDTLVRNERLAALGGMVAGLAHELNTPLGNSLLSATTLGEQCDAFSAQLAAGTLRRSSLDDYVRAVREAGDILQRNLHRANELMSSFREITADHASMRRRPFVLKKVLDDVMAALQPTLRRTPYAVVVSIDPELGLDSYPGALEQVVVNLINNALTHAFEGRERGTVRIEAAATADDAVMLRVADDGVGIPASLHARIFDPFFTTRLGRGGTGLGLNIVHNLVTNVLGGTIDLASEFGRGTMFVLRLPQVAPVVRSGGDAVEFVEDGP